MFSDVEGKETCYTVSGEVWLISYAALFAFLFTGAYYVPSALQISISH